MKAILALVTISSTVRISKLTWPQHLDEPAGLSFFLDDLEVSLNFSPTIVHRRIIAYCEATYHAITR